MPAAQHAAQGRADEPEPRGEVDVEHRLPVLVAHPHRQPVAGDAGIVDKDVDLTERGLALAHQTLGLVGLGEIGVQDMDALAELAGERLQRYLARAGQQEPSRLVHAAPARSRRRCRPKRR